MFFLDKEPRAIAVATLLLLVVDVMSKKLSFDLS